MANTLTGTIAPAYAALDTVLREPTGFLPAVTLDATASRVAKDQTLYSHVAPDQSLSSITPAMAIPSAADQTIGTKTLTISNFYETGFSWTGEEEYSVDTGSGFNSILMNQIAQAVRAIVNRVESDIATAVALGASRAYGTAGTTPFASDLSDTANVAKILIDNGMFADPQLVIDTTAGAKVKTLAQLTKANEAADTTLLRQGVLLDIHGFKLRESAQVTAATAGTASGATVNNAGYAIGATTLTLSSAGTGTILAGDVVTFAGDTNKYVVETGDSDVSNGGTIVIAKPGLRVAMSAATKAITVIGTSRRNCAFSRAAVVLGMRLPKVPAGGDLAVDRQVITDPRTGISMELALYPGYRMNKYVVSAAWGVSVFKTEGVALLLG